jgi:hypothetical protein
VLHPCLQGFAIPLCMLLQCVQQLCVQQLCVQQLCVQQLCVQQPHTRNAIAFCVRLPMQTREAGSVAHLLQRL